MLGIQDLTCTVFGARLWDGIMVIEVKACVYNRIYNHACIWVRLVDALDCDGSALA